MTVIAIPKILPPIVLIDFAILYLILIDGTTTAPSNKFI